MPLSTLNELIAALEEKRTECGGDTEVYIFEHKDDVYRYRDIGHVEALASEGANGAAFVVITLGTEEVEEKEKQHVVESK